MKNTPREALKSGDGYGKIKRHATERKDRNAMIKKLEERGYVRRTRSTEDERVVMITLTEEGRALKEEAANIPLQVGSCVHLSPEEGAMLHSLLYKILETV